MNSDLKVLSPSTLQITDVSPRIIEKLETGNIKTSWTLHLLGTGFEHLLVGDFIVELDGVSMNSSDLRIQPDKKSVSILMPMRPS